MKLYLVLAVVVGIAIASAPSTLTGESGGVGYALPETDDVIDTYAYNADEVFSYIPASFTDFAVCDDFINSSSGDCPIATYTTWGVTTASNPAELELLMIADDGTDAPAGAPTSQNSYPVTATNSGFTFGGYTVWIAQMDIGQAETLLAGETVWLGPHRNDGSNWYAACGTTVSGSEGYRTVEAGWAWETFSTSIGAGDIFKIIVGGVSGPAINRGTWAGIKSGF